jgi:hypothetical protein
MMNEGVVGRRGDFFDENARELAQVDWKQFSTPEARRRSEDLLRVGYVCVYCREELLASATFVIFLIQG